MPVLDDLCCNCARGLSLHCKSLSHYSGYPCRTVSVAIVFIVPFAPNWGVTNLNVTVICNSLLTHLECVVIC